MVELAPGTIVVSKSPSGLWSHRVVGCSCYRNGRKPAHLTLREAEKCSARVLGAKPSGAPKTLREATA